MQKIKILLVFLICCFVGFFVFGCVKKDRATSDDFSNNNLNESIPDDNAENESFSSEDPIFEEDDNETNQDDGEQESGQGQEQNFNKFATEESLIKNLLNHDFSFNNAELVLSNSNFMEGEFFVVDIETSMKIQDLYELIKNNFSKYEILEEDCDGTFYFFVSLQLANENYEIFVTQSTETVYSLSISVLYY